MPSWWGKSSSKEGKKKENKESIIYTIQRKLKSTSEDKCNSGSGGSRRHTVSNKRSQSPVFSGSASPSTHVSRCQSFAERPHAQALPLPGPKPSTICRTNSAISVASKSENARDSKPSQHFSLPKPGCASNQREPTNAEEDIATASISSDTSNDSDCPSNSRHLSSLAFACANLRRITVNSSFCMVHEDQSSVTLPKNTRALSEPVSQLCNYQSLSTSPKGGALHLKNLQMVHPAGLCSAPDSSLSSPCRSPMRALGPEQDLNAVFWTGKPYSNVTSGHCSSSGSGHNSGHNSVVDLLGQICGPQSRGSAEFSPIPSPRMTSPGPSSRIHSGTVTPLHPRARSTASESPKIHPDDGKQQSHRLPLPPIAINNSCPFSPAYSAATTPSAPRSPSRAENLMSPGSRWKKGQLLGRGTFGHVYLGFNSESGEMCAMKEVILLSDDAKSRECAQQLCQEITLLSCLRHPNIVQYYGSETVDDKLYIYLEYVSGGSIYKLLQEYGKFGENAIRNFTRQILSGLAYLHAKNTVHRDIKGANILVDPNGRVKLADFGMAKHMNGQSCPLSFKGSPYWMAPEVIKNSNGCNLAVDIWSLGCTVLEMATTKPPWSQYEGIAAMFKIGNSKELPTIPNHLSEDGKEFVRLCLQRNPLNRPSAAQLLEHPFIKNSTMERPSPAADHSELSAFTNAVRSLAIGTAKQESCIDSEGAGIYPSRSLKLGSNLSNTHGSRNISCPVSPIGSPHLPSRLLHASGRTSPSPISSPHTASGSSTPVTGGSGAIPFHQAKQPTFAHEGVDKIQRSQISYKYDAKHDPSWGIPQTTHASQHTMSFDTGALANQIWRPVQQDPREFYSGDKSCLADCVSQQLLRDHARLNSSINPKPSTLMHGFISGPWPVSQ